MKAEPREWLSRDEAETEAIGAELARTIGPEAVLLLVGTLGAGKTVLVRGLARALGVARREIQSPTYALIHEHSGDQGRLVHVDLYRLEPEQVESTGLFDLLSGPGLKAIEWPERLGRTWPGAWLAEIRALPDRRRQITARML